ncbi:MFS transporter [Bifidobacterium callimiconis]|uniref:MFS transporter n=1 Tax=Bifidobacterium callimiconis TaxID=2306973 RepID=A0A430FBF8_9BIFI|nr:MFS transporter [Bifidobacterium callimiconis]MBT1177048.1 MFS transporter [Bifidobacterium callimiconis]RSX50128.1 MFS transporter [Bifidobacterium callimiconis]
MGSAVATPTLETETLTESITPSAAAATADNALGERFTKADIVRFMLGFLICGLLWVVPFAASSQVLLPQRFRDEGFANPTALIAQLNAVGAAVALIANLVFGALSDRSRSRFGRRTPYMVIGSALAGLSLFLAALAPSIPLILLCWAGFQLGLNALLAPFLAVLSDRVPDTKRAQMSAAYGFGVTIGSTLGTIVGAWFITNQLTGFIIAGIALGIAGLATALTWPKEPSAANMPHVAFSVRSLLMSFKPPTQNCGDFYKALVGRLLIMLGYYMIISYQLYVVEDYIGQDAQTAAATIALVSVCSMVASLVSMVVSGPLSDKIGRRKPLVIACAVIIAIGFAVPFVWPTATAMYVFGAVAGFGLGIYNTCDQALNVDVLPSKEEAGKDLGILNLSNTFGQIFGPIVTSILFGVLGTYKPVFVLSIVALLASIIFIATIRKAK